MDRQECSDFVFARPSCLALIYRGQPSLDTHGFSLQLLLLRNTGEENVACQRYFCCPSSTAQMVSWEYILVLKRFRGRSEGLLDFVRCMPEGKVLSSLLVWKTELKHGV